jgi:hypothetical protein
MSTLRLASRVGFLAVVLAAPVRAAEPAAAPLPSGFRGDFIKLLAGAEKEMISLEQATPQEKFGWRPAKGVRSVAEVYLHAAGGIYFLLGQIGREAPPEVKALLKTWETQTTKKDEIKTILTSAFAWARKAAMETSDADLDKSLPLFGTELTQRAVFMITLGHTREHLGQSIAYARTNGVVPPWSKSDDK